MSLQNQSRHRRSNGVLFIVFVIVAMSARRCDNNKSQSPSESVSTPVENPIQAALKHSDKPYKEGIAASILIDTSGSMSQSVADADGRQRPKIEIAKRSALDLVNRFDKFAREHADQEFLLGIYEFSDRGRGPSVRPVVNLARPDPEAARQAMSRMHADGDTPIGDALIRAKQDLDAAGLSKRHILVITDGENTSGYSPVDVTSVITSQPENDRASIYFVAFDVAAAKFNSVKESGALVLGASNETDLQGTLNYLLTGKILAEQPEHK